MVILARFKNKVQKPDIIQSKEQKQDGITFFDVVTPESEIFLEPVLVLAPEDKVKYI